MPGRRASSRPRPLALASPLEAWRRRGQGGACACARALAARPNKGETSDLARVESGWRRSLAWLVGRS